MRRCVLNAITIHESDPQFGSHTMLEGVSLVSDNPSDTYDMCQTIQGSGESQSTSCIGGATTESGLTA